MKQIYLYEDFEVIVIVHFSREPEFSHGLKRGGFKFTNEDKGDEHEFTIKTDMDRIGALRLIIGVFAMGNPHGVSPIVEKRGYNPQNRYKI